VFLCDIVKILQRKVLIEQPVNPRIRVRIPSTCQSSPNGHHRQHDAPSAYRRVDGISHVDGSGVPAKPSWIATQVVHRVKESRTKMRRRRFGFKSEAGWVQVADAQTKQSRRGMEGDWSGIHARWRSSIYIYRTWLNDNS
jgi:hypothetical protein